MKARFLFFLQIGVLLFCYVFVPYFPFRFVFLFLTLMLIVSKVYSTYLFHHITVTRLDSEVREFRHNWVFIELILENTGYVPAPMLIFRDSPGMLPVYQNNRHTCSLRPRSRLRLKWKLYCSSRGVWRIGPASVQAADPLGLFPFILKDRHTVKLFIYPAEHLFSPTVSGGIPLGIRLSPNPLYEDLSRYKSLRPYQAGDELRRINWKASARNSGNFIVNEYEPTGTFPLMVVLNRDFSAYPLKDRWQDTERAIEIAAAVVLNAGHEKVGILIYDPPHALFVINPGTRTSIPILECLASLSTDEPELQTEQRCAALIAEQGKLLPYGTRLIYVGADLGDNAYRLLNSLKRQHIVLEYIVV